jgi:hypothetical protein
MRWITDRKVRPPVGRCHSKDSLSPLATEPAPISRSDADDGNQRIKS